MPGVIRTRVGYTGGRAKNPTYTKIGDHTETIQIDFDPAKTSYAKLLAVFWKTHNPCIDPYSTQYMSAVFCADATQRKLAEETMKQEEKRRGQRILTKILPLEKFYLAEDYHQKYYLRLRTSLMREYQTLTREEFLNSTAVMRVNSYVAGRGDSAQLQKEIDGFGLSDAGRATLEQLVKRNR